MNDQEPSKLFRGLAYALPLSVAFWVALYALLWWWFLP